MILATFAIVANNPAEIIPTIQSHGYDISPSTFCLEKVKLSSTGKSMEDFNCHTDTIVG